MGKIIEGPWKIGSHRITEGVSPELPRVCGDSFVFEDHPKTSYNGSPIIDALLAAAYSPTDNKNPSE
jgi:hypothetical protein